MDLSIHSLLLESFKAAFKRHPGSVKLERLEKDLVDFPTNGGQGKCHITSVFEAL